MSKWADFAIHAVRFNSAHTHIDRVRAFPDNGDKLGISEEHLRQDIVAAIKRGVTYVTTFKDDQGNWSKGQPVFIVSINGNDYIKTVENRKEVDNLDNLPEF